MRPIDGQRCLARQGSRWYSLRPKLIAFAFCGLLVLLYCSSNAVVDKRYQTHLISITSARSRENLKEPSRQHKELPARKPAPIPGNRLRKKREAGGALFDIPKGTDDAADRPWIDEPVQDDGPDAYSCPEGQENKRRVCVYGPGSKEAMQMQPTFFYIDLLSATDSCYARVTGPSIFVVQTTYVGLYRIRGDYMAHEPGEHELWISCVHSHANTTIQALPQNSLVVPFFHKELVEGSPFPLTVLPNQRVKPRGCQPCTGPDLGTLEGQWIRTESIVQQCGHEALGAINEWHTDSHVWVPRKCSLPFFSRELFLDVFDGSDLLFVGDSSVRGMFCDLQNWAYFGIGPAFYTEAYVQGDDSSSSWDYRACGYNMIEPLHLSFIQVFPNPFQVANTSFRYFAAREADMYPKVVQDVWQQVEVNRTDRSYRAVVANFGLWWWEQFHPQCGPAALSRLLVDHLRCKHAHPLLIPSDRDIDAEQCNWKEALQVLEEGLGETLGNQTDTKLETTFRTRGIELFEDDTCQRNFPGRVVYRSTTGKFDVHNICMGGHDNPWEAGEICAQNNATWQMLLESYGAERSWDKNPLLLDVFDMVYARPDRSLDSFHFFHHKCFGRECSRLTYEYDKCCYSGTMFPFSASLSMTNLLIHQLAYDPLLYHEHI